MQSSSNFTVALSQTTETANMLHVCTSVHAETFTEGGVEKVVLCSRMVVRHSLGTFPSTDWSHYPSTAEPSAQAQFQREDAAFHLWGCKNCLGLCWSWGRKRWCPCLQNVCCGWGFVSPSKELQEDVSRLHNVRGDRKDVNWLFSGILQPVPK